MSSVSRQDKQKEEMYEWKQQTKSQLQTAMCPITTTANLKQYLTDNKGDESRTFERYKRHEADVDTTVAKRRTSDFKKHVVAGKGIPVTKKSLPVAANLIMTKKRKAACSGMVILVVAGGVIVAGGVVVCQMYPSSSAAALIRLAAGRVEESLSTLLVNLWNKVELYTKSLGQVVHVQWLALLRSTRLGKAARAIEIQALQGTSGFIQQRQVVAVCFGMMKGLRDKLILALSCLDDVLKLSMEWIRSLFIELTADGELFEQVQSFLLISLSSLAEALKQSGAVTASCLGKAFEWLEMESEEMNEVSLPSENFLAPLVTHQAAIQSVGRGLTAQELRAVDDVKRFEKRRIAIASATNTIIEDTRAVALASVLNVKMAAVEFIEERRKQLAKQYARSLEQALNDYERTSRQAEEEGGSEMLADVTTESRALINAAASLKRYLSVYEKSMNEKLMEAPVLDDQTFFESELRGERATEYLLSDSQLAEERMQSAGLTEVSVLTGQRKAEGMANSNLNDEEGSQIFIEIVSEGLATVDIREAPVLDYRSSEKALESDIVSEEQAHVVTAEVSEVLVVDKSSSLEGVHAEDQLQISAELTEIEILDAALGLTVRDEAVDVMEQTFATKVVVDVDNTLLEVELMQGERVKTSSVQNLSEVEVQLQQESRVRAQLKGPVDGTDTKLVVELTAIADNKISEEVGVKQRLAAVRTHDVAQAEIEVKGDTVKPECIQKSCEETLLVIGTESEQLNSESVIEVQVEVNDVMVLTELGRIEEEPASVHSHDEAIEEKEIQKRPVGVADEAQLEPTGCPETKENACASSLTVVDILESERMVSAEEMLELEQLEQILLQGDELVRIEEELRIIAEEEKICLQSEQVRAKDEITQDGHCRTDVRKRAEADVDFKSEDWQTSSRDTLLVLPRPALMQVGLFSVAFFGLATLAVYLFIRHRKHEFLACSRRRHRRWQRLDDTDESEAEEVVLLPDDSSDEEDDTDAIAVKQSSVRVIGRMANEAIEVISSGGEEDGEKGETSAIYKRGEGEEVTVKKEDLDGESSRLIVTERAESTVYTVEHSVTSSLDALADDSDTASVSPMAPRQETPRGIPT